MGLIQGDALTPLLLNSACEYTTESVQENIEELEMNGTHQLHLKILSCRKHTLATIIRKNLNALN